MYTKDVSYVYLVIIQLQCHYYINQEAATYHHKTPITLIRFNEPFLFIILLFLSKRPE